MNRARRKGWPVLKDEVVFRAVSKGQVAGGEGQQAVPELPAGLVEHAVGLRTDDPVGGEPALLLEGADGPVHLGVEGGTGLRRTAGLREQTESGQQCADVGHRLAGVAEAEQTLVPSLGQNAPPG